MTAASPLGASLSCAPPDFPPGAATRALHAHFGMTGALTRLSSERDVNYRVLTDRGTYVLKLANPAEAAEVTHFQTAALLHLEPAGLPVPRVIRSLSGQTEVQLPGGILRLLTYLDGEMMHAAAPSFALRQSMGQMAARLSTGLQGFSHPAADHVLQWDIKQASALRPLLADLAPDLRAIAAQTLDRFDAAVAPTLGALRWQVVHNDLNPHNILTSPGGKTVTGVLDFGDMVRTPLVCDMAVAASYQLDTADPLQSLIDFAAAYHTVLPLTLNEAKLILPLTETRWLTTLCIAAHRAARYPENAAYILRNTPLARAGLLSFAALDRSRAAQTLLTALRFQ